MTRRLIFEIDEQGSIKMDHDNFTAAELATLALVLQDKAMEVLKNGASRDLQISGPNDS